MTNGDAKMNKVSMRFIFKKLLIAFALLALLWLALFILFTSPRFAFESCVDNSGLWIEKEKKCYCEFERNEEKNICIEKLGKKLRESIAN